MGVCLYVCLSACEIHICVGKGPRKQFRYVASIIHKLLPNKVILRCNAKIVAN